MSGAPRRTAVDEVSGEHRRVVVPGIQTQARPRGRRHGRGPLPQQDGLAGPGGGDDQSQTARSDQVEVALQLGAGHGVPRQRLAQGVV